VEWQQKSGVMRKDYNKIAGQSVERLAALSDGVFAVAMTLLVLDLKGPASSLVHDEAELGRALLQVAPHLFVYLMSFLLLGIFWVGQQTQLNHLARGDRALAWIHLAFLFFVSLVPFTTGLMADYLHYRLALLVYWLNILALGSVLYWALCHSQSAKLVDSEFGEEHSLAIRRRILTAQALYAVGTALCVIDTTVSLGFILLVQLSYALGLGFSRRA
jgi:uncharacterized membrane protein